MLSLWIAIYAAILSAAAPDKVLNINWKCTDGAPCLHVVRPRGATAVVDSDVDVFKLEVSVHRQETDQERILGKWNRAIASIWDVEVNWYRLVEKGVRVPMQQCRNKLVCRASLLDDEAIVSAVENFSEKSLVGHHFLVQVKYDGRKAISEQEIIIERQVSGNHKQFDPIGQQKKSDPVSATSNIRSEMRTEANENSHSFQQFSPKSENPTTEDYFERKEKESIAFLMNSGLYVGEENPAATPLLYTVKPPSALPSSTEPSGPSERFDAVEEPPYIDEDNFSEYFRERMGINSDIQPTADALQVDDDGMVRITAGNGTQEANNFFTDLTIQMGPTATVIVVLLLLLLLGVSCMCCINRIVHKYQAKGMHRYFPMRPNKVRVSPREGSSGKAYTHKPGRRERDGVRKNQRESQGSFRRALNFLLDRLHRTKKKMEPLINPSAGWGRSRNKKKSDKSKESTSASEYSNDDHSSSESEQDGSNDEEAGDDDDEADSDSTDEESGIGKVSRKLKETGSKVFGKLKSNENLRKLKGKAFDNNAALAGARNAALNLKDGKGAMGRTQPGGPKMVCKRCLECLYVLLCPIIYLFGLLCECCCGWCQGNQLERLHKKANNRVMEFMPSRGRVTSSSSEHSESEDEINVKDLVSENIEKKDVSTNINITSTKRTSNTAKLKPIMDIGGRFSSDHISRVNSDSLARNGGKMKRRDTLFPSCGNLDSSSSDSTIKPHGQNEDSVNLFDAHNICMPAACPVFERNDPTKHSCHLNGGDTATTSSISCRNESLHSPRKRCGLHCIQQKSRSKTLVSHGSLCNGVRAFVERQPSRFQLPPRISRTPPTLRTPRSSSSSSSLESFHPGKFTDSSNSSIPEINPTTKRQDGTSSASSQPALQRTKDYYRQENEQMHTLMRTWEAETHPKTHDINSRGRGRSREWCVRKRNRQRVLCLEQEARYARRSRTNSESSKSGEKVIVKLPTFLPPSLVPQFETESSSSSTSFADVGVVRHLRTASTPRSRRAEKLNHDPTSRHHNNIKTNSSRKVVSKIPDVSKSGNHLAVPFPTAYDTSDTSSSTSTFPSMKSERRQMVTDVHSQSDTNAKLEAPAESFVKSQSLEIIDRQETGNINIDQTQPKETYSHQPSPSTGQPRNDLNRTSGESAMKTDTSVSSISLTQQQNHRAPTPFNSASIALDLSLVGNSTERRAKKTPRRDRNSARETVVVSPTMTFQKDINIEILPSDSSSSTTSNPTAQPQRSPVHMILSLRRNASSNSLPLEQAQSPYEQPSPKPRIVQGLQLGYERPIHFYDEIADDESCAADGKQKTASTGKRQKKAESKTSVLNSIKKLFKFKKQDKTPKPTHANESEALDTEGPTDSKGQTRNPKKKSKKKMKKIVTDSSSVTTQTASSGSQISHESENVVPRRNTGHPTPVKILKNSSTYTSSYFDVVVPTVMKIENECSGSDKSVKLRLKRKRSARAAVISKDAELNEEAQCCRTEGTEKRERTGTPEPSGKKNRRQRNLERGTSAYNVVNESVKLNRCNKSPMRSVVSSAEPSSPLSVIKLPHSPYPSCSDGDDEYLSLPNSPNVLFRETDHFQSKTDDFSMRTKSPSGDRPRYFMSHERNNSHEQSHSTSHEFCSPTNALNSSAITFLREEEHASCCSSDDNDEFWRFIV